MMQSVCSTFGLVYNTAVIQYSPLAYTVQAKQEIYTVLVLVPVQGEKLKVWSSSPFMALIDLTEKASKEIDQTVGARLLVTRRVTQSRIKVTTRNRTRTEFTLYLN